MVALAKAVAAELAAVAAVAALAASGDSGCQSRHIGRAPAAPSLSLTTVVRVQNYS